MPAKDKFHYQVKRALEKDDWLVTHDPYFLRVEGVNYPVDLGAEKLLAAERESQKILVEIKSFLAESLPNEYHTALGQYLDYQLGLEEVEPDRIVFLAIPDKVFDKIQKIPFLIKSLTRHKVRVIVFDANLEEITKWQQF